MRAARGQPSLSVTATCARTLLRELAAELQMCNNQRGFNLRHLSPWFPTKIRNNKNPFKAFNVFSRFLQLPPLPRCSWFLWHQNRSSLWKRSSSPLLFLEGARTASQAQNAFVPGLWIVGGEEVEQLQPRAAVQDLLTRRLPGGHMAGYLLFVHPGEAGSAFCSCFLCSSSELCPLLPGHAAPGAELFLPKASGCLRGVLGTGPCGVSWARL